MKIFFDTNVYISEALLGATEGGAAKIIAACRRAKWRTYVS